MNTKIIFLLVIIFAFLFSCGENSSIIDPDQPTTSVPNPSDYTDVVFPMPGEKMNTSITGSVLDITGTPIPNATVTCISCEENPFTTTDDTGNFSFHNVNNEGAQAFLSFQSQDKFNAFRRFPILVDKHNYTSIILRDKVLQASVSAINGGVVTLESGAQLTLPSNGVSDKQGQLSSGDIQVYLSWIDPSSSQLSEYMMGDLSGIATDGELMSLSSFGMLQVELEAMNGDPLNLANGTTAELIFPVPDELINKAPLTIPLWSYSEKHGYWVEDGSAQLVDGNYVGSVTHFSTWNVDTKFEGIDFSGEVRTVKKGNDLGLSFFQIRLSGDSFTNAGGWLSQDGSFIFNNVPAGEVFNVEIINYCGEVIQNMELGPFNESTVLDPIYISASIELNEVLVEGNAISCNGNPVQKGRLQVKMEKITLSFPMDEQGNFLFVIPLCVGTDASLQILNMDDFSRSSDLALSGLNDNYTLIDLILCEESEEYFYLETYDIFWEERRTYYIEEKEKLWYELDAEENLIFVAEQESSSGGSPFTIKFTQELILNQKIKGVIEDGWVVYDGSEQLNVKTGNRYEFHFSETGPPDSEGNPSYIQCSFTGLFRFPTQDGYELNGSFKMKLK